MGTSLNQGNCSNGKNSSRAWISSQNPCFETFVTSTTEVLWRIVWVRLDLPATTSTTSGSGKPVRSFYLFEPDANFSQMAHALTLSCRLITGILTRVFPTFPVDV